jgi:uncharacterized repeat protein (TIGR04138 family)
MPTVDMHRSLRALCRKDPRFRLEGYLFVLDALDLAQRRRAAAAGLPPAATEEPPATGAVPPWNVGGRDLLDAVLDLGLERWGLLAREVLLSFGLDRTDDVGAAVFNMVEGGILLRTSSDSPADYEDAFPMADAFEARFLARLKEGDLRTAGGRGT